MLIDAHFHSWQIARADYGWLTPELAPIYRDVSVPDWQVQAQAVGVTGGILVQAAPTEAETAHLLALADQHPSVLGVVAAWQLHTPAFFNACIDLGPFPSLANGVGNNPDSFSFVICTNIGC